MATLHIPQVTLVFIVVLMYDVKPADASRKKVISFVYLYHVAADLNRHVGYNESQQRPTISILPRRRNHRYIVWQNVLQL